MISVRSIAPALFSCAVLYLGAQTTPPERNEAREARVLTLKGTPFERGLTHGRILRHDIHRAVDIWKSDLAREYKMDAKAFIHQFAAQTDYQTAIREWTPSLLEEVRGIAEGAGVDFETMLVYQLIDEYWVNGKSVTTLEHCSAIGTAATSKHPAIIAQNMDLEGFRDGFETVLRIQGDGGLETLILTQPGLIALNGVNNHGIAVTVNTLAQLAHARTGLPVAFVIRGILENRQRQDAEAFVRRVKHASGQNYMIGFSNGIMDYEASADKIVLLRQRGPFGYHTNHPLANDDYSEEYRKSGGASDNNDNTHTRLAALETRLKADVGSAIIDQIKAALRSHDSDRHPICRHCTSGDEGCTFASVIMVLDRQPYLLMAAGAPDRYRYQRFDFSGN
jgi:predicted choloylglycine hydrolase